MHVGLSAFIWHFFQYFMRKEEKLYSGQTKCPFSSMFSWKAASKGALGEKCKKSIKYSDSFPWLGPLISVLGTALAESCTQACLV